MLANRWAGRFHSRHQRGVTPIIFTTVVVGIATIGGHAQGRADRRKSPDLFRDRLDLGVDIGGRTVANLDPFGAHEHRPGDTSTPRAEPAIPSDAAKSRAGEASCSAIQ